MSRKRKKTNFEESLLMNNTTYIQYYNRLQELSMSMFEWKNLPETCDQRYLEQSLFLDGNAIFFYDDILENYCTLSMTANSSFDVYGNPNKRIAYSKYNNYQKRLESNNSVIIWNNYLRTNSVTDVIMFAKRLYNLDRIIDVNANAQKTPVLVQCSERQRLTMLNLYKEYDGNSPFIFGDKDLNPDGLKAISTGAPFVSDKIYTLKTQIWNEALTYLGISNINVQKKERLITDEVTRNQGGTIASRYSRLEARRNAVEKINKMFDLNIEVNYREDFQQIGEDNEPEESGTDTIGGVGNE